MDSRPKDVIEETEATLFRTIKKFELELENKRYSELIALSEAIHNVAAAINHLKAGESHGHGEEWKDGS